MQHLTQDARFVSGQMGVAGVPHTWRRILSYHPHVHYLAPAGGLAADGQTRLPARKSFLLPVKAVSRIFRAKLRDGLRKTDSFADIPAQVRKQERVVHCRPVGSGLTTFKYLAPYIFRVAISNNRILKLEKMHHSAFVDSPKNRTEIGLQMTSLSAKGCAQPLLLRHRS